MICVKIQSLYPSPLVQDVESASFCWAEDHFVEPLVLCGWHCPWVSKPGQINHGLHYFVACVQWSPESSLVAGTGYQTRITHPWGKHYTTAPAFALALNHLGTVSNPWFPHSAATLKSGPREQAWRSLALVPIKCLHTTAACRSNIATWRHIDVDSQGFAANLE